MKETEEQIKVLAETGMDIAKSVELLIRWSSELEERVEALEDRFPEK